MLFRSYKNKVQILENIKNEYKNSISTFNNFLNENKPKYMKSLDIWRRNEESKFKHVKIALINFETIIKELGNILGIINPTYSKIIESIPVSIELQKYIPKTKKEKSELFEKADFQVSEFGLDSVKDHENDLANFFPDGVQDADIKFEEVKIRGLLNNESMTEEEKKNTDYFSHNNHFFIITNAGKPVYTTYLVITFCQT